MNDTDHNTDINAQSRADDVMEQMRTNTRKFLTTPCEYRMTGYSETPSRNGVAWHGVIRKGTIEVGRVSDAGVGGMLDFEWTGMQHMHAFEVEAKARYGDGHTSSEDFANDLATAAQYNKVRRVIFVTDDQDLAMGESYKFKSGVTLAQAKASLLHPDTRFRDKNPMLWDKSKSMFVPVADIEV